MRSLLAMEASPISHLDTLFLIAVGSMLLVFGIRAALGYRHYKGSIYPHIYDNYLFDYYYKLNINRDASDSAKLKKQLGHHRLVYANITNKEGKLVSQILSAIHPKGILAIAYLNTSGKLEGKETGDWLIHRVEDGKQKKYKIENPAVYLKDYVAHLKEVTGKDIQTAIAINDGVDVTNVHTSFKVIKYSELDELFGQADAGYGLNDSEIDEIFEKLGGKIDKK